MKKVFKWFSEENVIFSKTSEWDYPARVMFYEEEKFLKEVLLGAKKGGEKCFRKTLATVPVTKSER